MDARDNDRGAFPIDRPVEALIRDHNMVRKLFESYQSSDKETVKIRAAEQILMLMESHSLLEEKIFYPAVREIDPALVGHFEQEHLKTDELLVSLKRMTLSDPQALPMFEQAMALHMQHIQEEEDGLFPKLAESTIDMTPIGTQMQAYEAELVYTQAKASEEGAAR